ncbi:sulfatase-like hydrolase/transferase [Pontiella sp.]|uniref:sulfatase-like hydrolase/transferase n=1 Tax=Pontiella sp. TaxID=2837462 RepID=UPI003564BCB6
MQSKWFVLIGLVVGGLLGFPAQSSGGVTVVSDAAPASDILFSDPNGATWTDLIDEDVSTKHGRGQLFALADGAGIGYQITAVTVYKNSNQTFANDTLTLRFFEGTEEQLITGTGHSTATDGDDYFVGTTVVLLHTEAFTLDGTISDGQYVTFELAEPLIVGEDSDFGFLMTYDRSSTSNPSNFRHNEGGNGGRLQITDTEHIVTTARNIHYYVLGGVADDTTDADDDGLMDAWETVHFGNLDQVGTDNYDGDGLDNEAEETLGTDPNEADSDADGLNDGAEVAAGTDPLDDDSDDDGLLDGAETGTGIYVDSNNTGTDPLLADSDADGINDDIELELGYDPSDDTHTPDLSQKPNMIFIMVDDLDIREVGVYGQATLKTPRVDAMAAEGMLFTDFYTAAPVCQPSRSCLMTGMDARRSQDKHNAGPGDGYQYPLDPSRVTVAEVLKEAGYTTGLVGKWGIGGPTTGGAPWNQGFDFFCGYLGQVQAHRFFPKYLWKNSEKIYFNQALADSEGGTLYIEGANNPNGITKDWTDSFGNVCSHDVVVSEGLKFIEDNADKPFFLYCAWTPPHAYNYAAATVDALTDEDGLVYDPLDLDQTLINSMYPGAPFGLTNGLPDFLPHTYASMVSAVDRDTGRIMDKLVELGIDDKTLVIFCSDNGEAGDTFLTAEHLKPGYYDLRGAKKDTYEGGIREPFVAWWPGMIEAGSTSSVVGTFADILPTFAEMAGISTPPQITGRSILPALLGGGEAELQPTEYHYWYFTETSNGLDRRWRAVRQGDWKIVRDRGTDVSPPTYELFNLAEDLYETNDLSATETEILARMIPLVEGSHEVTMSAYFKADDEFYTKTGLTAASYLFGSYDSAGANNGYTLTPSGTGSGFNYLPFETGLSDSVRFDWKLGFPSSSAASFLVGNANDVSQCLAVRIDASSSQVAVSYPGQTTVSATLAAEDFAGSLAECELVVDPATGAGQVVIGSTSVPFDFSADLGPLRYWGYEVESSAVRASRPRWRVTSPEGGVQQLVDNGDGILTADYTVPAAHGDEDITTQYSTNLVDWADHPPGLMDLRYTESQGVRRGTWTLPADSLLPRNNNNLYIRIKSGE